MGVVLVAALVASAGSAAAQNNPVPTLSSIAPTTAAVFGRIELSVGTGLFWAAAEPALATSAATRTTPNIEYHRT